MAKCTHRSHQICINASQKCVHYFVIMMKSMSKKFINFARIDRWYTSKCARNIQIQFTAVVEIFLIPLFGPFADHWHRSRRIWSIICFFDDTHFVCLWFVWNFANIGIAVRAMKTMFGHGCCDHVVMQKQNMQFAEECWLLNFLRTTLAVDLLIGSICCLKQIIRYFFSLQIGIVSILYSLRSTCVTKCTVFRIRTLSSDWTNIHFDA